MRILVTGGAGFVGSNLAKRLAADGHDTVALDDFSSASWVNLVDFAGDVLTCDLAGDVSALRAAKPFDVIFHEASITDTTVMDQRKMMHNNVEGFRQPAGPGGGVGQPGGLGQQCRHLRPRARADEGIAARRPAQRLRLLEAGDGTPRPSGTRTGCATRSSACATSTSTAPAKATRASSPA